MANKVEQYQLRKPVEYHAVLWNGTVKDLVEMPDFNDLVTRIQSIDSTGLLTFEYNGVTNKVFKRQHYIIHSSDYGFYILSKEDFEKAYEPLPTTWEEESR